MGRRGPAPKSTALRMLHGDKANRFNPAEPIPRDVLPVCPLEVEPLAREVWDYTVRELAAMKTVTAADRDALICYCYAVINHRAASEEVRRYGLIIPGASGTMMRNPALTVQREAAQTIRHFAQEFGLTPSSRSRVQVMGAKDAGEEDNPFASAGS